MDQQKPSQRDIQTAFAVTNLEPEISEETLIAYAADRASPVEIDLVETMLGVDPTLAETIAVIREEMASVHEPLPAGSAAIVKPTKVRWLPGWFSFASTIVAVGACGLLIFEFSDRSHLIQDLHSKDKQVASLLESSQSSVNLLQRQIETIQQQLGSATSDKKRLSAQLGQAQGKLDAELASRANMTSSSDGIASLVAHALTSELAMPAAPSEAMISRGGPADIEVAMTPDRTSVRLPVRLSWSGPAHGDYRVEIIKGEEPIWTARSAQASATPPEQMLKPGASYAWRIAIGNKRGRWAGFRVSTESEAKQADLISKDHKLGPLEKGVAFANLGLIPEAEAQFKVLRTVEPSLADKLIRDLARHQK